MQRATQPELGRSVPLFDRGHDAPPLLWAPRVRHWIGVGPDDNPLIVSVHSGDGIRRTTG
jgi:hypothetical protein